MHGHWICFLFFTFGKNLLFLKSDKFGVRCLAFSFFPNLENPFSLPSCPAPSTTPCSSAQLLLERNGEAGQEKWGSWAGALRRGWGGGSSPPTLPLLALGREMGVRQVEGLTSRAPRRNKRPGFSFLNCRKDTATWQGCPAAVRLGSCKAGPAATVLWPPPAGQEVELHPGSPIGKRCCLCGCLCKSSKP